MKDGKDGKGATSTIPPRSARYRVRFYDAFEHITNDLSDAVQVARQVLHENSARAIERGREQREEGTVARLNGKGEPVTLLRFGGKFGSAGLGTP